ncbi:myosin-2 heavy chain-like [Uloborus diversus]|uniref:myosin-2 heavy chain-like n=1 Tax=Uloborus diversus TaxID=327109 RepID=UPI00240A1175|nr:myosin-2 heavy chain-like [Uloborus diversus]
MFRDLVRSIIDYEANTNPTASLNLLETLKREIRKDLTSAFELAEPLIEKYPDLYDRSSTFFEFLTTCSGWSPCFAQRAPPRENQTQCSKRECEDEKKYSKDDGERLRREIDSLTKCREEEAAGLPQEPLPPSTAKNYLEYCVEEVEDTEKMHARLKDSEFELRETQRKHDELELKLERMRKEKRNDELEITRLTKESNDSKRAKEECETESRHLKSRNADLERQRNESSKQLEDFQAKLRQVEKRLREVTEERDEYETRSSYEKEKIRDSKEEDSKRWSLLRSDYEELKTKNFALEKENHSYRDSWRELSEQKKELERMLENQSREIGTLRAQNETFVKLRTELNRKTAELEALENERRDAEKKSKEFLGRFRTLERELENERKTIENLNRRLSEMRDEKSGFLLELEEKNQREINELENAFKERKASLLKTNQNLSQSLRDEKSKANHFRKMLKEMTQTNLDLQDKEKKTLTKFSQEIKDARTRFEECEGEKKKLETLLPDLNREIQRLTESNTELERLKKQIETKFEELKTDCDNEIEALKKQIERLMQKNENLDRELQETNVRVEELNAESNRWKGDYEEVRQKYVADATRYEIQHDEWVRDMTLLKNKSDESTRLMQQLRSENEELRFHLRNENPDSEMRRVKEENSKVLDVLQRGLNEAESQLEIIQGENTRLLVSLNENIGKRLMAEKEIEGHLKETKQLREELTRQQQNASRMAEEYENSILKLKRENDDESKKNECRETVGKEKVTQTDLFNFYHNELSLQVDEKLTKLVTSAEEKSRSTVKEDISKRLASVLERMREDIEETFRFFSEGFSIDEGEFNELVYTWLREDKRGNRLVQTTQFTCSVDYCMREIENQSSLG